MSKQKGVFPCFSRKSNRRAFLSNKTLTSIFQRRKGRYNNIYRRQHCPIKVYNCIFNSLKRVTKGDNDIFIKIPTNKHIPRKPAIRCFGSSLQNQSVCLPESQCFMHITRAIHIRTNRSIRWHHKDINSPCNNSLNRRKPQWSLLWTPLLHTL